MINFVSYNVLILHVTERLLRCFGTYSLLVIQTQLIDVNGKEPRNVYAVLEIDDVDKASSMCSMLKDKDMKGECFLDFRCLSVDWGQARPYALCKSFTEDYLRHQLHEMLSKVSFPH